MAAAAPPAPPKPSEESAGILLSVADGAFSYIEGARQAAQEHAVVPNHIHARLVQQSRARGSEAQAHDQPQPRLQNQGQNIEITMDDEDGAQGAQQTVMIEMPDGSERAFQVSNSGIWKQGQAREEE